MNTPKKRGADLIILTDDAPLRERLRRKHAEYEDRQKVGRETAHCTYKRRILAELLGTGEADFDAMIGLFRASPEFDGYAFVDAWNVIAAYNRGDTSTVVFGTGLV